jgi:hypothetical protein
MTSDEMEEVIHEFRCRIEKLEQIIQGPVLANTRKPAYRSGSWLCRVCNSYNSGNGESESRCWYCKNARADNQSLAGAVGAGSDTEVRGDIVLAESEAALQSHNVDRWNMPDWVCKCGHSNRAIRSKCRIIACGLPRPSDERTTPPNPQTSSIQS